MKYAIFSDMHGNLEAYTAVLNEMRKEGPSRYICAGDIVGYGADPSECIRLTKEIDPVIVCGNHDWAAVGKTSIEYFNEYAKRAVLWTSSALTAEEKGYLEALDLVHVDQEISLVHGTLMRPESFDYVFNAGTAYAVLDMMKTRVGIIGHTHVPAIYSLEDGKLDRTPGSIKQMSRGGKYLINVGSIGQPRDGDPRAAYCIWDIDTDTIEIKRVQYDIGKAQRKMLDAGLPERLAHRLMRGR